jgi:UDP-N-acetylmuramoyl-tripeptide--D-alanyl-D-alanine ligase
VLREAATLVVVGDVVDALQALAAADRAESRVPVVAITGSTGKTTTKDLVRAVLSTRMRVQAAPGSFNNELGLPLTLLGATEDHRAIITEMGARGIGHIAELTRIARPDVGIVTNVGVAHMELFGSPEAIAQAKGELVESLAEDGHAVLNADDPVVRGFASRTRARVWQVGASADADVRAIDVELGSDGRPRFTIEGADQRVPVRLGTPGAHMVSNALAAAAAGLALDVPLEAAAEGLADAQISAWRMETFTTVDGVTVINDAYNANPTSMEAALKAARWIARESRLCAVLGTMRELGDISLAEHERVGELAARLRVDRVVAVGAEARPIADAALREGVEPDQVAAYEDPAEALVDVKGWVREGDVVLFKGSRAVGLEKLAEAMR